MKHGIIMMYCQKIPQYCHNNNNNNKQDVKTEIKTNGKTKQNRKKHGTCAVKKTGYYQDTCIKKKEREKKKPIK